MRGQYGFQDGVKFCSKLIGWNLLVVFHSEKPRFVVSQAPLLQKSKRDAAMININDNYIHRFF